MRYALVLLLALGLGTPAFADIDAHGGLFRDPDVSRTHVVFVYAGDLWVVAREGGVATPLASPPGPESRPKFSADGSRVAFVGAYGGPTEIYTIPTAGGVPDRVTWHPADERLTDWLPGGDLVFHSRGMEGLGRQSKLYRVAATGGLPRRLGVPYGAWGSLSGDGAWLAYTPMDSEPPAWKRYRGGRAADIWLYHLADGTSKRLTDWEGTDSRPFWHDGRVYYVSDRGPAHRMNVWVADPETGEHRAVTSYTDHDIRWPSMGPGAAGGGEIVFQLGNGLHLLDLATEKVRAVPIRIPGAQPVLMPTTHDASKQIRYWHLSPSGKRAVVQARGDVWTLPRKHGEPRNLTRSSHAAERHPVWSPDGKWIAYFSDQTDEYELWVRPSDGKGDPRQVTKGGDAFRFHPRWSPDAKRIAFTDKAGCLHVADVATGTLTEVDRARYVEEEGMESYAWSPDSRWIVYAKVPHGAKNKAIHLWDSETGKAAQVTSASFNDGRPVFDRQGDFLYFSSNRHFTPRYSDIDWNAFVYAKSGVLLMVPLRADVPSPFAAKSDEEPMDGEAEEDEKDEKESPAESDGRDDPVAGTWKGRATGAEEFLPPGGIAFTLVLERGADGELEGSFSMTLGSAAVESASFERASGRLVMTLVAEDGGTWSIEAEVKAEAMQGTATLTEMGLAVQFEANRQPLGGEAGGKRAGKRSGKAGKKKAVKRVEIDLEGFEARAIQLPVAPGVFRGLGVNDKGALIYGRGSIRGDDEDAKIQLFDPSADKPKETEIASGTASFVLNGDGNKMLVIRGGSSATVQDARGSSKGTKVKTQGMTVRVDPRAAREQVLRDAWRIYRDYFYDPHMHGVDWKAVRERSLAMLADCVTESDLSYVIREMLGELNVGHANYFGADASRRWRRNREASGPGIGLLGCDFALENGAYRIVRIVQGAPWDVDARSPLAEPGLDVKAGDYLLAVNGIPVDVRSAPWAALDGLAGRTVTLTVSEKPSLTEAAREVLVKPIAREGRLRFRDWVERNRRYVEKHGGGRIGYVYVPDTGRGGQNELFRQFVGQAHKAALIIDERWNGGGQIPVKFAELLNRPLRNYWARRDGSDWHDPFFSHQGPKCMLMNGASGSGGDAFPAYFRQSGLGKLVGTRTWGGLVGISGNPGLVNGAWISVPTFAFYESDGTWGIEGHGVDPDIEVLPDPATMRDGRDPELDAGIRQMLEELETRPHVTPPRPAYPDRRGMGLPPKDR